MDAIRYITFNSSAIEFDHVILVLRTPSEHLSDAWNEAMKTLIGILLIIGQSLLVLGQSFNAPFHILLTILSLVSSLAPLTLCPHVMMIFTISCLMVTYCGWRKTWRLIREATGIVVKNWKLIKTWEIPAPIVAWWDVVCNAMKKVLTWIKIHCVDDKDLPQIAGDEEEKRSREEVGEMPPQARREEILQLHKEGKLVTEIASILNISRTTVWKVTRNDGNHGNDIGV